MTKTAKTFKVTLFCDWCRLADVEYPHGQTEVEAQDMVKATELVEAQIKNGQHECATHHHPMSVWVVTLTEREL